jgi:DNA invertase Pin-like site-specific DNA recombinase
MCIPEERKLSMKQKRGALYVREHRTSNYQAQERALREYVRRRGWLPHKIYGDKITGAIARRPNLDELLKD